MKTFVLNDGSEMSMEETIVHLLAQTRKLREDVESNSEIVNSLLTQFNYYEYHSLLDQNDQGLHQ